MIFAGILAIVIPPVAGIAATIFFGWLLIFSGIAHLIFAWHQRPTGSMLWQFLLAALYMSFGIYLLRRPISGLVSLTVALGIYFFLAGILNLVMAVHLHPRPGSGWLFVDAIISVILSIMIWKTFPSSVNWVLGFLVGFGMFFSGITRLMLSFAARSLVSRSAS